MTLVGHLDELRRRIIYALVGLAAGIAAALMLGRQIVDFLRYPYTQAMEAANQQPDLSVLNHMAGLIIYLKTAMATGLIIASPWIFYHVWMFVSAGLYPKERRGVMFIVPFSAALFIVGALFFVFVVAVPVLSFLISVNNWLGLEMRITFDSHVTLMARMALVFGLAFQTPLAVLILGRVGLVSLKMLHQYRRHVVIGILISAALLTPPDPVSQLCLAVPLWLLYELGVLLVWLLAPRAKERVD
ncbi:hypothetical protein LCGC14_0205070 [marine sediment metagenome]|uniref:Sec-independent protein translocase protein TatC n=1 Tax=marine sediment metagenome TaxID=412755 RepID=A0A0F9UM99_9ZZZZ